MAEPTPERAKSAENAGIVAHALDLLGAALAYFQARFALASLEGREAMGHYLKVLGLLLGGLVAFVFGYFFLCFAAVFAIAMAFNGGTAWIWVTFGAALLHLLLGAGLVWAVRSLLHRPVFAATFEEFKKDQAWLETKTAKPN